jgi:alkylation response protein AidB-like acyl-CoA dehydrogenase
MTDWSLMGDDEFRAEVRNFFQANYPHELRYPPRRLRWHESKPWYMLLASEGWAAPNWPQAYGGMGLDPAKLLIFIEEQERWGVARSPDMGVLMVGPVLIKHGTEDQRRRFLPPILAGDEIWCQGYSEPNAGSDLASLRTRAVLDGERFIVNGQKIWTTLAHDATHMFALVRTDTSVRKQEGISFLLVDLRQPGVTVRTIANIAGHEELCEVFLDDVVVPVENLVGELNKGWTIAKSLLGFERIFLGSPKLAQYALRQLEALAVATNATSDARFLDRFTQLRLDVADLATIYGRFADIVIRGESLGPDVSLLKIWITETFQRIADLMLETAAEKGVLVGKGMFGQEQIDVLSVYYNSRPATIYGGSNEIQRNVIAKSVLNLPG